MATRWYLGSDTTNKTPNMGGSTYTWDDIQYGPGRARCKTADQLPANRTIYGTIAIDTTTTTNWDVVGQQYNQWITLPLQAQTISGGTTFRLQLLCYENDRAANAYLSMMVKHYNAAGTLVTELGYAISPTEAELDNVTNRYVILTLGSDLTISSGDYLVFELGARFVNTKSNLYQLYYYPVYNSTYSDLGSNETDTSIELNPWIECSQTLQFSMEAAIACASTVTAEPFVIIMGGQAWSASGTLTSGYTYLDLNNPANNNGILTVAAVKAGGSNLTGIIVGTWYGSGNNWTMRSSQNIADIPAGTVGYRGVSLNVEVGDIPGLYAETGIVLYDFVAGNGAHWAEGNRFDGNQHNFGLSTTYKSLGFGLFGNPTEGANNALSTNLINGIATTYGNLLGIGALLSNLINGIATLTAPNTAKAAASTNLINGVASVNGVLTSKIALSTNLINGVSTLNGTLLGRGALATNLINGISSVTAPIIADAKISTNLINGISTCVAPPTYKLAFASNLINGISTVNGVLTSTASLSSNLINGTSSVAGNLLGTGALASNLINGISTCAGVLTGTGALASSLLNGISTLNGTLLGSLALSTNLISGTSSCAGNLLGTANLASNLINGTSAFSGTLLGTANLASNLINGIAGVQCDILAIKFTETNLINGTSTLFGDLIASAPAVLATDQINGISTLFGDLLGTAALASNLINGVSTLTGSLQALSSGALSTDLINGIATCSGDLLGTGALATNLVNGTSNVVGDLLGKTTGVLVSTISAESTCSGTLLGTASLASNLINGTSTCLGDLLGVGELNCTTIQAISLLDGTLLGILTLSTNLINGTSNLAAPLIGLGTEQYSFRFRDDDNNEANATWLAGINQSVNLQVNENIRIRFLINAIGNPDPAQYQLEYKKSTDSQWTKVA